MISPKRVVALALTAWMLHPLCAAQDPTASHEPETVLVRAAKVIVRPGVVLENTSVLVRGGRIVAIGSDVGKPSGARELEAKVVCSAFIDPWSALCLGADGLVEGGATAATRAADAFDGDSLEQLRRQTVRGGVTCVRVQVGPTARQSGISAFVRVAPELPREAAFLQPESAVGMSIGLSANAAGQAQAFEIVDGQVVPREGGSRGMDPFDRLGDVDRVAAAVETGRNYLIAKNEYRHDLEDWTKKIAEKETELDKDFKKAKKDREKEEKDAKDKGKKFEEKKYKEDKKPQAPKPDEDSEVLARVANGEIPLVVLAHRTAELRALLAATEKQDRLQLVLAGATQALDVAPQLVERGIPVILTPALVGRGAPDELDGVDLSLPARLSKAGVAVLIGSGGVDPAASRDLALLAELAVGNGLSTDAAFEALTIGAARAFSLDGRVGSVERGKDAELLLLDGDPLTSEGRIRYVISAGRVVVTPEG